MSSTTFDIVDDTWITYSNNQWNGGGSSDEYNLTTHGTGTVGAQAIYIFNGSRIEVFGTIGRENNGDPTFAATSSYTIDNKFDSTVQYTGVIGSVALYKQLFFSSETLDESQPHTLTISYASQGKNPLWLDYLRVTRTVSNGTTTLSSSSSTALASSTTSPRPTTSATSPATSPTSSKLSPGVIAGIAVGSCAALLLLVIIFLLVRSLIRSPKESVEATSSDKHHRNSSWLSKLFTPKQPPPPPEIHPFDPYTTMSTPQYSQNTNPILAHQPSVSISSGPSSGANPMYHHGENVGYTTRGGRTEEKRNYPYALAHARGQSN